MLQTGAKKKQQPSWNDHAVVHLDSFSSYFYYTFFTVALETLPIDEQW